MSEVLHRDETTPALVPIPDEVFKDLIATVPGDDGEARTFERPIHLPGLEGSAKLLITSEKGNAMRAYNFHYIDSPEGKERYAASMTLGVYDNGNIVLSHRLVKVESGNGVGTALYRQAEEFIQRLSTLKKEAVTISAEMDQYDVMKWLPKQGYEPVEESRALYEDIMANVGKTDKYYVDYDNTSGYRLLSVFERTPEGNPKAMPVRVVMKRVVEPALAR